MSKTVSTGNSIFFFFLIVIDKADGGRAPERNARK